MSDVVPLAGLEPARVLAHLILSQARLPVPPQGRGGAQYSGGRGAVNAETAEIIARGKSGGMRRARTLYRQPMQGASCGMRRGSIAGQFSVAFVHRVA